MLCDSVDSIPLDQNTSGVIYCVWGEHEITRVELKHGVRFSLNSCPNALAWSITMDSEGKPENNNLVIHCTINTREHEQDFIESIHVFVTDWVNGITKVLKNGTLAGLYC